MSDEDQRRPAPTLDLDIMRAIGRELRRMYADIIAEGCRNASPRSCAGWTSRATRARKTTRRGLPSDNGEGETNDGDATSKTSSQRRTAPRGLLARRRGRSGVTAAIMLANGFKAKMLAHLDQEGLATATIAERVKDDGKMIEVVRFRITAAGRETIEG